MPIDIVNTFVSVRELSPITAAVERGSEFERERRPIGCRPKDAASAARCEHAASRATAATSFRAQAAKVAGASEARQSGVREEPAVPSDKRGTSTPAPAAERSESAFSDRERCRGRKRHIFNRLCHAILERALAPSLQKAALQAAIFFSLFFLTLSRGVRDPAHQCSFHPKFRLMTRR